MSYPEAPNYSKSYTPAELAAKARRYTAEAEQSEATSDAYAYLVDLIANDDRLAPLADLEFDRAMRKADVYAADARSGRSAALGAKCGGPKGVDELVASARIPRLYAGDR